MTTTRATTPERKSVRFPSGSEYCDAWLYVPDTDRSESVPVVVMAHGLGGVKQLCLDAFAERFQDAGYACLVFDYRYFGDSDGEPRQLLDIDHQLEDWRAAVAFARTLSEVDADRVILWGTSFGGGHVIATAAEDPQIAATIAQCPFTDGIASVLAIDPRNVARLTALGLRDLVAELRGGAPRRVPVAARPGETGLMTAPDVVPGYQALRNASIDELPDEVPARIALDIPLYRPGRRAKDVHCPILFAICERDSVAPPGTTLKHAQRAPKAEIERYDMGHFDIYLGEEFDQAVGDQIEFLEAHVPPETR